MGSEWAYFDYTAATPPDAAVLSAYLHDLQTAFANTGAVYAPALAERACLEDARARFAALIGADAAEIVFTSGATEADNLAIKGAVDYHGAKLPRVITVQTEHKAVLDTVGILAKRGVATVFLPVDRSGVLELQALEEALQTPATLVSVMAVNNETGVMQPLRDIADIVHAAGAKLHIDAAQALGKIAVDVRSWDADAVSFSGHKAYAPKGVGALYLRRMPKMRIQAQLHGGGQERGRRSGTLPAALIRAFVLAAEIAVRELPVRAAAVRRLADALIQGLPDTMQLNTGLEFCSAVPHILSIRTGRPAAHMLRQADAAKIALSAGSACQSGAAEGSHVLMAMGLGEAAAQSLRISLSHLTTAAELGRLQEFLHGESRHDSFN